MKNNFNCDICNFGEKTPKTNFCDKCNLLKCKITKLNNELKSVDGNKLNKRKLFQKKYKAEYLLELRTGMNSKIKRSSLELENLYNCLEIFLKRSSEINVTYHCVNQFHSLPQKYKSFIFSSLSHVLFDSVKKYYPNNLWYLLRKDNPWEN